MDNRTKLKLRSFKYDAWLRPHSLLYRFLASQPTITSLIGVDVFPQRVPHLPPSFLPSLRHLICQIDYTATALAPSRPICSIIIRSNFEALEAVERFVDALQSCPGPLDLVNLPCNRVGKEGIHHLFAALKTTKSIILTTSTLAGIGQLSNPSPGLEEFTTFVPANCKIDASVATSLAHELGPNVRCLRFFQSPRTLQVWRRQKGSFQESLNERRKNLVMMDWLDQYWYPWRIETAALIP
ncbi:hypothetical protein DL93DRAFT_2071228 [Clavulina sp. PMI_390]|nr:hypothetical protein DL93DRAFT_2071228 [Clavulina sp. PMI_390]